MDSRKAFVFALIAIFFAIIGWVLPVTITGSVGTMNHANLTNLNWSAAGHVMDSDLEMNNFSINNPSIIGNLGINQIFFGVGTDPRFSNLVQTGTFPNQTYTLYEAYKNRFNLSIGINGTVVMYSLNQSGLDMGGKNITNCGNCSGFDNLSWQTEKVNKTGDTMTGTLKINPVSDGGLNITTGTLNTSMTINSTVSKSGTTNDFTVDITGQDVFGLRIGNLANGSGQGSGIQAVSGEIGKTATQNGERAGFMLFKGTFVSGTPGSGLSAGSGFLSYNTEAQSSTNQGSDLRLVATQTGTTTRPTIAYLRDGRMNTTLNLTVGNNNGAIVGASGITIYDPAGNPHCLRVSNSSIVTAPTGQCN